MTATHVARTVTDVVSARGLVVITLTEMRHLEVISQSFLRESDMLAHLEVPQRPANYAEVVAHVEAQLQYYRLRLDNYRDRALDLLTQLHLAVRAAVLVDASNAPFVAQCHKVLALEISRLPPPGIDVTTQRQLINWVEGATEAAHRELELSFLREIDRLIERLRSYLPT